MLWYLVPPDAALLPGLDSVGPDFLLLCFSFSALPARPASLSFSKRNSFSLVSYKVSQSHIIKQSSPTANNELPAMNTRVARKSNISKYFWEFYYKSNPLILLVIGSNIFLETKNNKKNLWNAKTIFSLKKNPFVVWASEQQKSASLFQNWLCFSTSQYKF